MLDPRNYSGIEPSGKLILTPEFKRRIADWYARGFANDSDTTEETDDPPDGADVHPDPEFYALLQRKYDTARTAERGEAN